MTGVQSPSDTSSGDYSSSYYNDVHLGGEGDYGWENEEWRGFFRSVADRIVGIANPTTVLDVGCAKGILVQALREKGVDAVGLDISEHAIESSHPDVRDHLRVASATDPIEGRYSLVSCIEVLEHMAPRPAQVAIDRMTEVSDRVLFSSSPSDHAEPTHINTKPTAAWASAFAERGFFRRTDVDLSFLSPWAVLFERAELTVHELAHRYETQYFELNTELVEKRTSLLDSYRRLTEAQAGSPTQAQFDEQAKLFDEQAKMITAWEAEVLEVRHQLLTTRDHVVGTEAEMARLTRDNAKLRLELGRARKQVDNLRGRLADVRVRVRRLNRRNHQLTDELEAGRRRPSIAKRAARRILGDTK